MVIFYNFIKKVCLFLAQLFESKTMTASQKPLIKIITRHYVKITVRGSLREWGEGGKRSSSQAARSLVIS